jgi:hypothetical protein
MEGGESGEPPRHRVGLTICSPTQSPNVREWRYAASKLHSYRSLSRRRSLGLAYVIRRSLRLCRARHCCLCNHEAARALSGDPHDIPFAAIYVADEACDSARLVASAGLPEDHPLPPWASLAAGDATPWPLASVFRSEKAEELRDLRWLAGPLPGSPWPEPPSRAVVLPVPALNHGGPAGLLPHRVWDDSAGRVGHPARLVSSDFLHRFSENTDAPGRCGGP